MRKKVHSFLLKYPYSHYVLACSGGIDSMVLVHCFSELNLPFSVVHVNYQLRGKDSNEDARFVKEYCAAHGIPCRIKKVNLKKQLEQEGGNLQQEARNLRYAFLREYVKKLPNAIAVTAHHEDDQLETFWLHMVRDSGLSGLSGMLEATPEILRPFLGISRKTIERYALKHQIPFREDRSNAEIKYLRNFFRLEALPYLYHTHPSLKKNLLFLLSVLKKSYAHTKQEAKRLAQNWKEKLLILLEETELDPTLLVEALKEIQVEPRFLKSILELTHSEHGKQVQVSSTLAIVRTSMGLQLNYLEQAIPMRFTTQTVHTLPSAFDNWNWYLNPEQVEQELRLTPFEAHEQIQANGLKREKSINALLKSAGIPEFERKKWPVLRCGDNIVGVPGVAIAHSFRADTNGNSFLKVTFERC